MKERIEKVIDQMRRAEAAVGGDGDIGMLLRLRGGYLDYDDSEWVVEMVLISKSDVAAVREGFDNYEDARNKYHELKMYYNLVDMDEAGLAGKEEV